MSLDRLFMCPSCGAPYNPTLKCDYCGSSYSLNGRGPQVSSNMDRIKEMKLEELKANLERVKAKGEERVARLRAGDIQCPKE